MATLATMTEQRNSREKENENVDSRAGAPLRYFNDRGGVGVEVHMFYAKKIPEFVYLKNFYCS